ncbi:MSMEG_1061 family FMN-dependent PPOX-type flavoprotein [Halalkalibacter urbisdiaboli]|uniref:MSMEG_1061 family FMN-dependent PPOX-type flavoprotein n=1 Tax=Halalkalibacter urbisdiaboli TaxID=1960589 RepID=UPI001FD95C7D|nr:MSMEG_1061 family FMN-dependent PPOX-type flavoprotein [Halalkalibacter urbisdiaboli]
MSSIFKNTIQTEEQLREIVGYKSPFLSQKVTGYLDDEIKEFISLSPFIIIASSNMNGHFDASPRGDAPGFVHIIDDKHFIIPERTGNKRIDSMVNLLSNPGIGLIFFIPGVEETLRINGKATITSDRELLEPLIIKNKTPLVGIGVKVEECFIHCNKAFKRAALWNSTLYSDNKFQRFTSALKYKSYKK